MNCPDCRELLQRRLDGEPAASAEAQAHLLTCADCRAEWEAADQLLRGLAQMPPVEPPAGLARRVLAEALRERVAHRRVNWQRAAVAAALLLTPWLAVQALHRDPVSPPVAQASPVEPLVESLEELQGAVASLGAHLL